jgi:hypothetical protein
VIRYAPFSVSRLTKPICLTYHLITRSSTAMQPAAAQPATAQPATAAAAQMPQQQQQ